LESNGADFSFNNPTTQEPQNTATAEEQPEEPFEPTLLESMAIADYSGDPMSVFDYADAVAGKSETNFVVDLFGPDDNALALPEEPLSKITRYRELVDEAQELADAGEADRLGEVKQELRSLAEDIAGDDDIRTRLILNEVPLKFFEFASNDYANSLLKSGDIDQPGGMIFSLGDTDYNLYSDYQGNIRIRVDNESSDVDEQKVINIENPEDLAKVLRDNSGYEFFADLALNEYSRDALERFEEGNTPREGQEEEGPRYEIIPDDELNSLFRQ
jgi:hypothetical protein